MSMSAFGTYRTLCPLVCMSAFGGKVDIHCDGSPIKLWSCSPRVR